MHNLSRHIPVGTLVLKYSAETMCFFHTVLDKQNILYSDGQTMVQCSFCGPIMKRGMGLRVRCAVEDPAASQAGLTNNIFALTDRQFSCHNCGL